MVGCRLSFVHDVTRPKGLAAWRLGGILTDSLNLKISILGDGGDYTRQTRRIPFIEYTISFV